MENLNRPATKGEKNLTILALIALAINILGIVLTIPDAIRLLKYRKPLAAANKNVDEAKAAYMEAKDVEDKMGVDDEGYPAAHETTEKAYKKWQQTTEDLLDVIKKRMNIKEAKAKKEGAA